MNARDLVALLRLAGFDELGTTFPRVHWQIKGTRYKEWSWERPATVLRVRVLTYDGGYRGPNVAFVQSPEKMVTVEQDPARPNRMKEYLRFHTIKFRDYEIAWNHIKNQLALMER